MRVQQVDSVELTNRRFTIEDGGAPADAAGNLAPGGIVFISEEGSPVDNALLAVGYG